MCMSAACMILTQARLCWIQCNLYCIHKHRLSNNTRRSYALCLSMLLLDITWGRSLLIPWRRTNIVEALTLFKQQILVFTGTTLIFYLSEQMLGTVSLKSKLTSDLLFSQTFTTILQISLINACWIRFKKECRRQQFISKWSGLWS